ncbi:MAG TPA: hypothetical protein VGF69_13520 [Thermoanaerobaculia bacterium]|jgi:hypothetical protein
MKDGRALVILVWLASLFLWFRPGLVRPDGAGYLVYLPSVRMDGDLLFFDEWQQFGMIRPDGLIQHKEVTATGHLANHWTVGSALVWFPLFAVADGVRFDFPRNGIALPYNVAVVFTSALAGLVTLLCGMRVAPADPRARTIAAIGAWLGTPLLFYSLVHATMSHAISAMASALVFLAIRNNATAFLSGAAAGLAFAVRPQNAPFAAVPFILGRVPPLPYFAGLAAGALPQLIVSQVLYGTPFGFMTGGASKAFAPFERIRLVETLFSWYHGLVPWTPFAALGIAGLLVMMRFPVGALRFPIPDSRHPAHPTDNAALAAVVEDGQSCPSREEWREHADATASRDGQDCPSSTPVKSEIASGARRLALACLFVFITQWLINGLLERSFWGATAFGQRRFDNCTIVFLIGAAALVQRFRVAGTIAVAAASLWTLSLFFAAQQSLDLSRYVPPRALLGAQLSALANLRVGFLEAVPPPMKIRVLSMLVVFAVVVIAAVILLRKTSAAFRAVLAGTYLAAASLVLVWCGLRDRERIEAYRPLIEHNRPYAAHPAGADFRRGLLRDELDYLERSGRETEAARTRRELQ